MHARALGIVAVLALVPLAGCIENMADLKDRLQGSSTTGDTSGLTNKTLTNNLTKPAGKDPVASIDVYFKGGAKLHGSYPFSADGKVGAPAIGDREISFVGSGSEALGGATLTKYEWSFGDGKKATGSTATHTYPAMGGVFKVVLKVTDSKGRSDTQTLDLAVLPAPVVVNSTHDGTINAPSAGFRAGQLAGQASASVPFTIEAQMDGSDVKHVSTILTLAPKNNQAADMSLYVTNSTGARVGASEASGPNEAITLEGLPADAMSADVWLELGLQGQYVLTIVTTYQPVNHAVEAFFGDGHGHAH